MRPAFQERFQVYVMGPDQDPRLALVAAGDSIQQIKLKIDLDAPFVLRRRAIGPWQLAGLETLATKWTGPNNDYRSDLVLESLRQPYYGLMGNPMPVSPGITYPPGGTLTLDLENRGLLDLVNVTFYWIGVNLYPWGALPAPTYPAQFRSIAHAQDFIALDLGHPEIRLNLPFTCKSDGDFAIRGGQAGELVSTFAGGVDPPQLTGKTLQVAPAMFIVLKDYNGHPYMNDWVDINVLFGLAGQGFGTGPEHPGIIYPEIYLPAKQQLLIDVYHVCGVVGRTVEDLMISFHGAKVFKGAS